MFGGFFDRYHSEWNEKGLLWFETLLNEDDVDVLAWAFQTQDVPAGFAGPHMTAMQRLDFIDIPR